MFGGYFARSMPRTIASKPVLACLVYCNVRLICPTASPPMHLTAPVTEKRCVVATRELQEALLAAADGLQQTGNLEAALVTRFRAYALRPGFSPVLHSIARVYDAMGDAESAQLCRRGVVPESAEATIFNARSANSELKPARRASDSKHCKIHGSESVDLPAPVSNADSRQRPEFRARRTESRGSFVSVLTDGHVWFDGFNTLVKDSAGKILKEHVKGSAAVVADVSRSRAQKTLTGTVCFIDARSSSIYYHWMMDVLPKIALLQQAGIQLDSIDHFIVRCQSEFQRQTLQHLGISPDQVQPPPADQTLRAEQLIVPFLKHDRGDRVYNGLGLGMARWVPAWLNQTFVPGQTRETPASRLYISRAQRGTRAPVDEQRLITLLQRRGFASVSLEELSVVQQASLLASAAVVVAPHGAGLTNITFCKPGTMVVEIFGDYVVPCYWALSTLAGLDYRHYLAAEAREQKAEPSTDAALKSNDQGSTSSERSAPVADLAARRNSCIELDVDDFVEKLDGWLNKTAAAA